MKKSALLKKRYRIIRQLGSGGMAKTFLASDSRTSNRVVVKMLDLQKMHEWKALELFDREAKTLKNIHHPFIPDYIDYFTEETNGSPSYYLVQGYVDGRNLEDLAASGGRLTDGQIANFAKSILSILSYLHAQRPPVIHRDLNPRNIILSKKKQLHLVDFGAVTDAIRNTARGGSTIVGTYGYMPPEQLTGNATPASDLYALGATVIFLLTHKSPGDIPVKHLRLDYKSFTRADKNLIRFIDACIEPDVALRVSSAEEALAILENRSQSAGSSGSSGESSRQASRLPAASGFTPPFGSRLKIARIDSGAFLITMPGSFAKSLPYFGFAAFWYVFIFAWTAFAFSFAGLFSLFSVPFWIAGLFLIAKGLEGIKRQTIRLTPENIELEKSALGGKLVIPLDRITRVAYERRERRLRTNTEPGHEDTLVIEAGAVRKEITKFLTKNEIEWIATAITDYKKAQTGQWT